MHSNGAIRIGVHSLRLTVIVPTSSYELLYVLNLSQNSMEGKATVQQAEALEMLAAAALKGGQVNQAVALLRRSLEVGHQDRTCRQRQSMSAHGFLC